MATKVQANYKGFKFYGEMAADRSVAFTSILTADDKDASKKLRLDGKSLIGRSFATPAKAGRAAFDAYYDFIKEDRLPAGRFLTLKQPNGEGVGAVRSTELRKAVKPKAKAEVTKPAKAGKAAKVAPEDKSIKVTPADKSKKEENDSKAMQSRASRRAGPVTTRKAVAKAEPKAKAVAKGKAAVKAAPKSRKPAPVEADDSDGDSLDFED